MAESLEVVALCGSLRRESLNRRLMEAAIELAPPGMTITEFPIRDLPLYDGDLDGPNRPAITQALKDTIAASDGMLVVTPEYNHASPGGLANAIDWASRPHGKGPMAWLPCGLLSASPASTGGARGQAVIKLMFDSCLSLTYPHPGFVLGQAKEKIDQERGLHHEPTRAFLADYLAGFATFIQRVRE